eukprot:4264872-Ditylum_brightwellii.AAC.1
MLEKIFDNCVHERNCHPKVCTPGRARASTTSSMGSYDDALKKLSQEGINPQDDNATPTNVAPAQMHKRQALAISLDEYPPLENNNTAVG